MSTCRKGEHGGPDAAILREACLQDWPLAGVWRLGFWEGSHHSLIATSGSPCLNCLCKPYGLCWTPAFPPGVWNFGNANRRMPMWRTPHKNSVSKEASQLDDISHTKAQVTTGGIKHILKRLYWERTLGSLRLVSSEPRLLCLFPLLVLLVSFACNKS